VGSQHGSPAPFCLAGNLEALHAAEAFLSARRAAASAASTEERPVGSHVAATAGAPMPSDPVLSVLRSGSPSSPHEEG
jgi:hypothetical protein